MAGPAASSRTARTEILGRLAVIRTQLGVDAITLVPAPSRHTDRSMLLAAGLAEEGRLRRSTVVTDLVLGELATVTHPADVAPDTLLDLDAVHHVIPWLALLVGCRFEELAEVSARHGHYTALLYRLTEILDAAAAICWTYDDQAKPARFRHFTSWGLAAEEFFDIPRGEGLIGTTDSTQATRVDDLSDPRLPVYHPGAVARYGWTHVARHPLVTPNGLAGALAIYFRGAPRSDDGIYPRTATLLATTVLAAAAEREWFEDSIADWKARLVESANRMGVGVAALGMAHDLAHRAEQLQTAAEALSVYLGPLDGSDDNRAQARIQLARLGLPPHVSVDSVVNTLANLDVEARYLSAVVGQLNELAKGRNDRQILKQDLAPVVRKMVPLLTAIAAGPPGSPGAQLSTRLTPDLRVRINATSVVRILLNLVMNAVNWKAREIVVRLRPAAEERLLIRRGHADLAGFVALSVADDGKGMSELQRQHCLEPFKTGRPDGSGLGLFVVDELVRTFGGRVDVFSQPEKGTTVVALLPLAGSAA